MKNTLIEDAKPLLIAVGIFMAIAFIGCAIETWYEMKHPQRGRTYYVATLEMEGAIGERAMLENDLNRRAYEKVQEGTASESDHERAVQYEMDHSA